MKTRHSAILLAVLLEVTLAACSGTAEGPSSDGSSMAKALSSNGVTATLSLQSDWGAGYCANVVLANTSSSPVTNWTVVADLNQSTLSQQPWGGTSTQSGTQITVKPVSYTASIAPGASVSFGFCGSATGSNYRPTLLSLTVVGGSSDGGSYRLTVQVVGNGSTSPAAGTSSYAAGTDATVTATPASGYTFAGWSGACSGTSSPCTVSMTADQTVTATFTPTSPGGPVSINAGGAAAGSFIADAYYSGGSTYSSTNAIDTSLLTGAAPPQAVLQTERYGEFTYTIPNLTPGSAQSVTLYFEESYWTAAGQRTFNVAVNGATVLTAFDIFAAAGSANRAVARTFDTTANSSGQVVIQFSKGGGADNPKVSGIAVAAGGVGTTYPLSVTRAGTGSGTVTGAGINCGSTCSASYASGTTVTLTAAAAGGSTFAGWSGACVGTGTCIVSMTAARSVTATFSGPSAGRSAGCGKARTLQNGTITIQVNGTSRWYILRVPDNYDNTRAYRLIVAYHWLGGTAQDVASGSYYGLWNLANNSTIFVAPMGTGSGSSTGWPNTNGVDLAFTDALLAQVEGDLCIDTTRIFATGFSYGAGMSYAIACARANVFRGVALYSGAQLSGCSGGTTPIAYWASHGLSDSVLNVSNGRSLRDHFVSVNGCTPQNPPEPAVGSGTHICTSYQGCSAGHSVSWCAFDGDHNPSQVDRGQSSSWIPPQAWSFISQF